MTQIEVENILGLDKGKAYVLKLPEGASQEEFESALDIIKDWCEKTKLDIIVLPHDYTIESMEPNPKGFGPEAEP